jgi:hypothetical protein
VPVENREPFAVEIERFSSTCNCLSVEPKSFTLGPGETQTIRLQIDLTSQARPTGDIAVGLTPRLKSGARWPEWTVRGRVRRVLTMVRKVDLGQHSELAQPFPPWTVPVESALSLDMLSVQCDVPGLVASISRPTSEEGKYLVELRPAKTLPVGNIDGTLTLTPRIKGGETLPSRRLPVRGSVVADLEASPPLVQVGGRRMGESFQEEVTLHSLTGRALTAVKFRAEGQGLVVEPTERPDRFRVRQAVALAGTQQTQVRFSVVLDGRNVELRVPVEYTGVNDH